MNRITLKKILERNKLSECLRYISADCYDLSITDHNGAELMKLNFTETENFSQGEPAVAHPLLLDAAVIGWVRGKGDLTGIVRLLEYAAEREQAVKGIARDALDKYREINFLYNFTEKITTCLEVAEIAALVVEEARSLIKLNSASVMLYNEISGLLEVVAGIGDSAGSKLSLRSGEGIAGHIFASGRGEIINDVAADPRFKKHSLHSHALICVPLMTKERVLGVINISNVSEMGYRSEALKLLSALAIQSASAMENALLQEQRLRQQQIRNNLGRYLSPHVMEAVINSPDEASLSTSRRRITMLFSDIRNFTSACEELEPEEIVGHLNDYFTSLVDVIFCHSGTVNKFVGDMIVAMFGAPAEMESQELQAITAAIAMQRCIRTMPVQWIRENFHTGIGISCGESVVGNIGSEQHMDYTAIGDEVNIAARLQAMAHGGQILVTRSVRDAALVPGSASFHFREFGLLPLKGRKNSVDVFEVVYE